VRQLGADSPLVKIGLTSEELSGFQSLRRLRRDLGDQLEVLVQVQDGEAGQLGGGGDDQVRNGRRTMSALIRPPQLNLDCSGFNGWVRYSTGIATSGGPRKAALACGPERAEKPISSRVTVVMRTRPRWI
jgi:hypothetical protein